MGCLRDASSFWPRHGKAHYTLAGMESKPACQVVRCYASATGVLMATRIASLTKSNGKHPLGIVLNDKTHLGACPHMPRRTKLCGDVILVALASDSSPCCTDNI